MKVKGCSPISLQRGEEYSWKPHPLISNAIPLTGTGHMTAPSCKGNWETEYFRHRELPDRVSASEEENEAECRPSVLSIVPVESHSTKAGVS